MWGKSNSSNPFSCVRHVCLKETNSSTFFRCCEKNIALTATQWIYMCGLQTMENWISSDHCTAWSTKESKGTVTSVAIKEFPLYYISIWMLQYNSYNSRFTLRFKVYVLGQQPALLNENFTVSLKSFSTLILQSTMVTVCSTCFHPLKTNRRPLYLKTQFVPHSKHFSSRL